MLTRHADFPTSGERPSPTVPSEFRSYGATRDLRSAQL
jgi:hypothetical protein